MIYIGAENIISPLGMSAAENFANAAAGKTGLRLHEKPFSGIDKLFAAQLPASFAEGENKIEKLANQCIEGSLQALKNVPKNDKWLLVLSSTKGNIEALKRKDFTGAALSTLATKIQQKLPFAVDAETVSVACISGLAATIYAADAIALGDYDHAVVVGADVLSNFTVSGFQSFYALDENQCKPFDENRAGLNLGEAAASVVLSKNENLFAEAPKHFAAGATSNDANHISGPSRTGEGLFRAIDRTLKMAGLKAQNIDYVSAHGTGTRYNDDMESIAFYRANLHQKPVNSLKGYFGHTLGASSLIEIAMGLQSMRHNLVLKSHGCNKPGTAESINLASQNMSTPIKTMLKTASGFGGSNAAAIIKFTEK